MEPRKESKKPPESRKAKKPRFQIPKLEERIAPCSIKDRVGHYHYRGPCGGWKNK